MKDNLRKNLNKKKTTEDECMQQAEQEQRDDLVFHIEPGGASYPQGSPPKVKTRGTPKAKAERSRSRDIEPKTEPKSEPKSEMKSEATPKAKKEPKVPKEKQIRVKKDIEKNPKAKQRKKK